MAVRKLFVSRMYTWSSNCLLRLVGCLSLWHINFSRLLKPNSVFIQTILFSISTHFCSILPINRTLSGTTTPGLSGPGSDGNEGVLCISRSSSITGSSPSDCLVSYPGHFLGECSKIFQSYQPMLNPDVMTFLEEDFWRCISEV